MGENEEQQVQGLLSDFSSLQSRFQGLQNLVSRHHVKRYCELDTQMGTALSATLSLARLLNGEFNPSNPPAELASTLQTMESNWAQTKDAAKKGYDELSSYSATIVQFHDADIGGWRARLNTLQDKLKGKVSSTQAALLTSKATSQQLIEHTEIVRESARVLEKKLYKQQHKYDEADKWTWLWPPARLALEALKPIIEAITHDLQGARQALNTATTELNQAQDRARTQEDEVIHLNKLATDQAILISKVTALMEQCNQLQQEAEQTEVIVAQHKSDSYQAWQESSRCFNRARTAEYALTKADYATAILKIMDVYADDPITHASLTEIVTELADHDDNSRSVHKITTDEHPSGLLDDVEKKLQQGTVQYTIMTGSSSSNPVRDLPVAARLKLIRSMVGALVKPRGQPGSLDICDADRVNLLALVSSLFVTSAGGND